MDKKYLVFIDWMGDKEVKVVEIIKETEKSYKLGRDNNSFRSLYYKDQPHKVVTFEEAERVKSESKRLFYNYKAVRQRYNDDIDKLMDSIEDDKAV
jgi:uncharacterized protein YktA (UPF0223 family)